MGDGVTRAECPDSPDEIAAQTLDLLSGGVDEQITLAHRPVMWRTLTAVELSQEWPRLLAWVQQLRSRYPNSLRLPECWWRHSDLVEPLAALRDYERGCFENSNDPRTAVDWHRAFRDIEARLEVWVRRLPCAAGVGGHSAHATPVRLPDGWLEFVTEAVQARL